MNKRQAGVILAIGAFLGLFLAKCTPAHAGEFTATDAKYELLFDAVWYADWKQTRDFNGRQFETYSETNIFLGRHPNSKKINEYFIAGGLAHLAVSYIIPRSWRPTWRMITIGYEANTVAHNISVGVNFHF